VFEDILEKNKKQTGIIIWILKIGGEGRGVEVFNAVENDRGVIEGYIKNTTLKVDNYTDYRMSIPTPTRHFFKVTLLRINKTTIKFHKMEDLNDV
jgi:hypothetical protein